MARTIANNEHRQFNNPPTLVPLFDIALPDQPLYYTPNHAEIIIDGKDYTPFPVILDEIRDDGKGEIATVQLSCANIDGVLGSYIKQYGNVDGQAIIFKLYSCENNQGRL